MADALTLTDSERLWFWRRGFGGQGEAARRLGIGRTRLSQMENGRIPVTVAVPQSWVYRQVLLPSERLLLLRRRSGLALREVAVEAGVCHVTLLRWEAEADKRLMAFWERRESAKK